MTPFDPRLPIIATDAKVKTCHVFHCWQAMRDMGKGFHVAAFANFAGLDTRHVDAILAALEAHDALPERRAVVSTRGQRLAPDWAIPDDWVEWASVQRRWQPADAQAEAEQFADYWHSKPGQGGVKLDWRKTWQNWVRTSRRPDGDYRPSTPMVSTAAHMERTAAIYDRMGRTTEAAEIRQQLAANANVIPFSPPLKTAQN